MVPVVLPVGGLPGGLDEHASQGPASATCRQHAVMSQQSRLSTRAVNETSQKFSQYLDKAPTIKAYSLLKPPISTLIEKTIVKLH